MKLLLDTCAFLWLASDLAQFSEPAAREIQDDANEIFFSHASAWEICLKVRAGKIHLPDKPLPWISGRMKYWKIAPLEISLAAVCQTVELPPVHKDPFDRLLVAQALAHNLAIVTPDPFMQKYAAQIIW